MAKLYKIIRLDWSSEEEMSKELNERLRLLDEGDDDVRDYEIVSHSQDREEMSIIVGAEYL